MHIIQGMLIISQSRSKRTHAGFFSGTFSNYLLKVFLLFKLLYKLFTLKALDC